MRDHAHSDTADKAGVEEAGDGDADCGGRKGEREIASQPIDLSEDLLRREDERKQGPLHAAGRERISESLTIGEGLPERAEYIGNRQGFLLGNIRNKLDLTDRSPVRLIKRRLKLSDAELTAIVERIGNSISAISKEVALQRATVLPEPAEVPPAPAIASATGCQQTTADASP